LLRSTQRRKRHGQANYHFLFSINDALGKWLLADYSVGELLLVRSAAGLILLAPLIRKTGITGFRSAPRPGLQIVRVILSTVEVALFFWAVSQLPLADTKTFYLAGPIYVTALSVVLLGESVGWRRWTAVFVGFAGVVLALRPSTASFTPPVLIALTGSVLFALFLVRTALRHHTRYVLGPDTLCADGPAGAVAKDVRSALADARIAFVNGPHLISTWTRVYLPRRERFRRGALRPGLSDRVRGEFVREVRHELEVDHLPRRDVKRRRDDRDQDADREPPSEGDPAVAHVFAVRAHAEKHQERRQDDPRVADHVPRAAVERVDERQRDEHERGGDRP
jgi:multidrug transporter EmrE-like cation transporter